MSDLKSNKFKFNDARLKKLPLPAKGMSLFYDTEVKGLMLRLTEAAHERSFFAIASKDASITAALALTRSQASLSGRLPLHGRKLEG
jgi:hypothetical protein